TVGQPAGERVQMGALARAADRAQRRMRAQPQARSGPVRGRRWPGDPAGEGGGGAATRGAGRRAGAGARDRLVDRAGHRARLPRRSRGLSLPRTRRRPLRSHVTPGAVGAAAPATFSRARRAPYLLILWQVRRREPAWGDRSLLGQATVP